MQVGVAVILGGLFFAAMVTIDFLVIRRRTRHIESSGDDKAERVHRLQRLMLIAMFSSMLIGLVCAGIVGGVAGAAADKHERIPVAGVALIVIGALLAVGAWCTLIFGPLVTVRRAYARVRDADVRAQNKGRAAIVAVAFLVLIVGIQVGLGATVHGPWRPFSAVAAYLIALVLLSTLGSPLLLFASKARRLDKEHSDRLWALADRLGVHIRDFRVVPTRKRKLANAAQMGALPGMRYIVLTDYLLDNMSDDEVDAVVAHELGHARGNHVPIKLFSFIVIWLGLQASTVALTSSGRHSAAHFALLVLPLCFVVAVFVVQGLVGITLERKADDAAAAAVGTEPLARTLENLGRLNDTKRRTGRTWSLLTQHPGLEQRIERLRSVRNRPGSTDTDSAKNENDARVRSTVS